MIKDGKPSFIFSKLDKKINFVIIISEVEYENYFCKTWSY